MFCDLSTINEFDIVNTTVFIAAISNSEQLGNSVYANEARAADGLGTEPLCTWGGKNNTPNNQ